ncbi:MAG: AMP-binding protein [Candidatus Lokiarchaeota archaeon]|nr:AMP-binding protein [Candidatus Lokiarchaeota archaeon]
MTEKMMESSPYSEKIWLKSYDDHVKPEIDFEIMSLADTMKNAVKNFPNKICCDLQGTTTTYKEIEKKINCFANFFIQNGLEKGDRIAIHLPNIPQYVIALYGTFYAGCTSTGMNFLLQPNEIIYQLKDSGAVALVTLDSFYEQNVRKALSTGKTNVKLVITTNVADTLNIDLSMKEQLIKIGKIPYGEVLPLDGIKYCTFNEVLAKYPKDKSPDVKIDPFEDIAFLQYTGGTTGPPKGAMLTHANEIINLQQVIHQWEIDVIRGKEIFISGFPLFHLAGMFFNLGAVNYAATQLLIPDPRDVNYIANKIIEYHPTFMANVPTLYLMLLKNRKFKKADLSSFKIYVSGAAPFPAESIREFEDVVGKHKVLELYGMTEASPIVTLNPYIGKRKIGTVGIPVSNTDVKIVAVSDKSIEVPIGEPGEIVIKGPQIFQGYWNQPEETNRALKDGWFYSGDVGIMDEDGYIKIVDRTKDMIIVSGFKVFSVEVDNKMNKHPAIELCSCIGIPDPDRPGSEIVKLYILLKKGYEANEEIKANILKYAQENLAKYKIPKIIEISDQLPLTAVGKIDKKALRKM